MKTILLLITLSLSLVACSNTLTTTEKAQAAALRSQIAPNVTGTEQPGDKCLASAFEYSDVKKEGDVATATLKYQTGVAILAGVEGKALGTPEGCERLNTEIRKLTGSMLKWEVVELSWNTKTGKQVASRHLASDVNPGK